MDQSLEKETHPIAEISRDLAAASCNLCFAVKEPDESRMISVSIAYIVMHRYIGNPVDFWVISKFYEH